MVVRNHDEQAQANEVLGDDAGGNRDQPPMDVDEQGRLAAPMDAADYAAEPGTNPFADDGAQAAVNKPTGKPKGGDENGQPPAKKPTRGRRAGSGIALDESPGAEAGTPGGDAAKAAR
jgi:hypothetical protein